eukprot:3119824-Amphidinium_carterae.1
MSSLSTGKVTKLEELQLTEAVVGERHLRSSSQIPQACVFGAGHGYKLHFTPALPIRHCAQAGVAVGARVS